MPANQEGESTPKGKWRPESNITHPRRTGNLHTLRATGEDPTEMKGGKLDKGPNFEYAPQTIPNPPAEDESLTGSQCSSQPPTNHY